MTSAPNPPSGVSGVVLCGGRGRRMGGADKGTVMLAGRMMVEHVVDRLRPQVSGIVLNANRNADIYARFGVVAPDIAEGYLGPLAGVHAGMETASEEWVLSSPCDTPLLPLDLSVRLARAAAAAGADIAVARAGGRAQPVFMLCRRALRADLKAFLDDGGRKIDLWYPRHAHAFADFPDVSAFANANTEEDMGGILMDAGLKR